MEIGVRMQPGLAYVTAQRAGSLDSGALVAIIDCAFCGLSHLLAAVLAGDTTDVRCAECRGLHRVSVHGEGR